MSVQSAMYSGISGLYTNGEGMSVIGNNISNVNTIGFKQGRAIFSDMLSTTINQGQIGRGEQIQAVQNIFSQGSFESTGSATDLAIQGDGFFVLTDAAGLTRSYSRAGAFTFDKNDVLVNPDGYQVLGYGIRNNVANGVLAPIDLTANANIAPAPSTTMAIKANFDATAAARTFNSASPYTTSNFSTSIPYYDATGASKTMTVFFSSQGSGTNTWDVNVFDGTAYSAAGTVGFTAAGALNTGALALPGGISLSLTGSTQYAGSSTLFSQTSDGYAAGNLTKVTVDDKGYVNGSYSNGLLLRLAQVALAKFQATDGLDKIGGSLYAETAKSGTALISAANTGTNKILSNSLEQSNVDLAEQLVKMIVTQRAYSASSKTITTADQMMQDTLNLVR